MVGWLVGVLIVLSMSQGFPAVFDIVLLLVVVRQTIIIGYRAEKDFHPTDKTEPGPVSGSNRSLTRSNVTQQLLTSFACDSRDRCRLGWARQIAA